MLQFISHQNHRYGYIEGIDMALQGGCRWIQLRVKDMPDAEYVALAKQVVPLCRHYGARIIFDDRVHLVKSLGADGVHLGRNDMPIGEARRLLGNTYLIGGTANTIDDIRNIARQGADYIGCGPFRFTATKSHLAPLLGLDGYRKIVQAMRREQISLPVVAIGGIVRTDIQPILQTGIGGIALSGAVLNADNPIAEMKKIIQSLTDYEQ